MDGTDKKIIELLQQDARMDDLEIARRLGISDDTVKRRRIKLEKAGYITLKAMVNPDKFGYTNIFILGINLVPGADARKTAEKLALMKEFFLVVLSLGPTHSIIAHSIAKDQLILNKLVEELRTWKEIEKIETNIIYEVLKSGYHNIPVETL